MGFWRLLKARINKNFYQAKILFIFSFFFSAVILGNIVTYTVLFYAKENVGKNVEGSILIKSCEDHDEKKFMKKGQRIPFERLEDLCEDDRIKDYDVTCLAGAHGKNVSHMSLYDEEMDKEDENGNLLLVYQKNMLNHYMFKDWGYKIIEGRALKANEVGGKAVVTQTFSEENSVTVGDTIELESVSGQAIKLQVVGISNYQYQGNIVIPVRSAEYNYIFTTQEVVEQANESSDVFSVNLKLKDCGEAETLLKDIKNEYGFSDFLINQQTTEYKTALVAIVNNETTVFVLLATVIIMGAVIIGLFSVYSLTGRLKEIGILRCIGMKRRSIIAQYVAELLIPVLIGNMLCLCIFLALKVPLTNYVTHRMNLVSDLNLSLQMSHVLGYFSCSLIVILFAVIYMILKIVKCKPKELLIE